MIISCASSGIMMMTIREWCDHQACCLKRSITFLVNLGAKLNWSYRWEGMQWDITVDSGVSFPFVTAGLHFLQLQSHQSQNTVKPTLHCAKKSDLNEFAIKTAHCKRTEISSFGIYNVTCSTPVRLVPLWPLPIGASEPQQAATTLVKQPRLSRWNALGRGTDPLVWVRP